MNQQRNYFYTSSYELILLEIKKNILKDGINGIML